MIPLIILLIAMTLLAIVSHIESLDMHKNYHLYSPVQLLLSRVLTITLYIINSIIILIVIFKLLSL